VGGGKRLFAEGVPKTVLELTSSRALESGTIIQVYEPVRD